MEIRDDILTAPSQAALESYIITNIDILHQITEPLGQPFGVHCCTVQAAGSIFPRGAYPGGVDPVHLVYVVSTAVLVCTQY